MRFYALLFGFVLSWMVHKFSQSSSVLKMIMVIDLSILTLIFLVVTIIRRGVPNALDEFGLPKTPTEQLKQISRVRRYWLVCLEVFGSVVLGMMLMAIILVNI